MEFKIGNELIADYMGFTHSNHGWENKNGDVFTEALDYHTDWNHLMDCVEKCFNEKIQYDFINEIEQSLTNQNSLSTEERKQNVWRACIHLIQYKNKQK